MKSLVLSGGSGSRLRPLTWSSAKQLVPIANKPVLYYVMESLQQTGIVDTGIIVGQTGDAIRQAIGDGSRWGLRVSYIDQPRPLGLAHAVQTARPFLQEHPFLMVLGDNLLRLPLRPLVERFASSEDDAHILLAEVEHPEQFGVAEVHGDRVVRLVEKPTCPPSNLALVGVYLFRPVIHEAIGHLRPSARGELEITDAIQWLIDHGYQVRHQLVQGWWKDTGTFDSLLEANRLVLDTIRDEQRSMLVRTHVQGPVQVGSGCIVDNCVIRGPVVIGDVCELRNCQIGPYVSIGNGCRLAGVTVKESIILNGSCIVLKHKTLFRSVIGANVSVKQGDSQITLILGDNSEVVLNGRR